VTKGKVGKGRESERDRERKRERERERERERDKERGREDAPSSCSSAPHRLTSFDNVPFASVTDASTAMNIGKVQRW